MEPYPNDPRAGGAYPAGNPPAAQGWSGPGMSGGPAWAAPNAGGPPPPGWSGAGGQQPPGVVSYTQARDSKWPALRLIASILKVVAWVEGGLGAISALVAGVSLSATIGAGGFLVTLFFLLWVAIAFLMTYASSEIIMLFISIEKNTRKNEQ